MGWNAFGKHIGKHKKCRPLNANYSLRSSFDTTFLMIWKETPDTTLSCISFSCTLPPPFFTYALAPWYVSSLLSSSPDHSGELLDKWPLPSHRFSLSEIKGKIGRGIVVHVMRSFRHWSSIWHGPSLVSHETIKALRPQIIEEITCQNIPNIHLVATDGKRPFSKHAGYCTHIWAL